MAGRRAAATALVLARCCTVLSSSSPWPGLHVGGRIADANSLTQLGRYSLPNKEALSLAMFVSHPRLPTYQGQVAGAVRVCGALRSFGRPLSVRRGLRVGGAIGARGAMSIRVVTISQTKEKWADTASDDYCSRVKKMGVSFDQVVLKPSPGPPKFTADQQKEQEGKNLLSRVDMSSEMLVVLDERGDLLTSHQLASLMQKSEDNGVRVMTFAIGGAHGHSPEVQKGAHKMISLSKMVMNHQIARVVLMEQIYRAYTILKNIPYHK